MIRPIRRKGLFIASNLDLQIAIMMVAFFMAIVECVT